MEPFVALGLRLQARGHDICCAFPEQFRSLAEAHGLAFASLGSQFMELLDSADGRAAMGGASGWKKVMGTLRLAVRQKAANQELLLHQQAIVDDFVPEHILYNGKATYPMLWVLDHPGQATFISPVPYMHYVRGYSHVAFHRDLGPFLNQLSFRLADFGLITTLKMSRKWLGLPRRHPRAALRRVVQESPTIYTISPTLFPRPDYWPPQRQVLGFYASETTASYEPSPDLRVFLSRHPKILFISFGSMLNADPAGKTRLLLDILDRHQIPAIINTAAGGLQEPDDYERARLHFVRNVPYSWLFPRVSAVIHHGGSGTTHMGLRHGCPTLIVPHIVDQYAWAQIVHQQGAGPAGLPISKLRPRVLEARILDLWQNPAYPARAGAIAQAMVAEDFSDTLFRMIEG